MYETPRASNDPEYSSVETLVKFQNRVMGCLDQFWAFNWTPKNLCSPILPLHCTRQKVLLPTSSRLIGPIS